MRLNSDGTWTFFPSSGANLTSSGVPIVADTWMYLELKVVIGATGSVQIRVNGTLVLNASSIDTMSGSVAEWTSVRWAYNPGAYGPPSYGGSGQSGYLRIDDFYLLDGTTGTYRANNDFWGDTSVRYLQPSADTATKDWSRSAGSDNYALVAEGGSVPQTPDDDTTYISTSTVDGTDLYDFPAVTSGATITGVQAVIAAKKGDTGSAQVAAICKSASTTEEHPSPLGVASDSAYSYFLFPWNGDPNATSDWTESTLNAAQFGPRKTA